MKGKKRCDPGRVSRPRERAPRQQSKKLNRNLAEWCKGTLQTALEEISYRRQSMTTVVNAAYTSQVDSRYGVLLGTRHGDRFFTFDGEVIQADCNAARVTILFG